jgi:hypothetical protein
MSKLSWVAATAAAVALLSAPAQAQDWTLDPTFGTYDVPAGFTPDPMIINGIISGGGEDVSAVLGGCNGYVATAPDVRINYTAGGYPLTFATVGPDGSDVTLLINGPDGAWYCNDDVDETTLNAALTFTTPMSGQYDVWIGTYNPGENFEAALALSELVTDGSAPLAEYSIGVPYDEPAATVAADLMLLTGFTPDPARAELWAGGAQDGAEFGCIGWYNTEPSYVLDFQTDGGLPLILSANSALDATLMVIDPNGEMACDDDGGNNGFNPSLTWATPVSGIYFIYLGSYSRAENGPATLSISELYSE